MVRIRFRLYSKLVLTLMVGVILQAKSQQQQYFPDPDPRIQKKTGRMEGPEIRPVDALGTLQPVGDRGELEHLSGRPELGHWRPEKRRAIRLQRLSERIRKITNQL